MDRRVAAGQSIVLGLSLLWVATMAVGQDVALEIPLTTLIEAEEGTQHLLVEIGVPSDLQGAECSVKASAQNQESVHPGNDLVLASGEDLLLLEDVEGEAGGDTLAEGTLMLGTHLSVTLLMGSDGLFSAGMVVEVICPDVGATTTSTASTTTIETSTTAAPTTTMPDTTTSVTVEGTTTTTMVVPTTMETTSTTDGPGGTLPFTGSGGAGPLAAVALIGVLAGSLLVGLSRRPDAESSA